MAIGIVVVSFGELEQALALPTGARILRVSSANTSARGLELRLYVDHPAFPDLEKPATYELVTRFDPVTRGREHS